MQKTITIIGSGISGLATLHYLNQRFHNQNVSINLVEKNSSAGGNIASIKEQGCLFETGPNALLSNKPQTLKLINELELQDQILQADSDSSVRYISLNNVLHEVPTNPYKFITSKLLSPLQKATILCEPFKRANPSDTESVFDFAQRRLGQKFAEVFIDAMVSGIHGADAKQLNLKLAFPRMYELESQYGSLFKAMFKLKKTKKPSAFKSSLFSFNDGMQTLVSTIAHRYHEQIHFNQQVTHIERTDQGYQIHFNDRSVASNVVILCTPAFVTAELIKVFDSKIAQQLKNIQYVPMNVVGLVFQKDSFDNLPNGFGYLIPSNQDKQVLGVLVESNIFANRCNEDEVLIRVMIGGAHHLDTIDLTDQQIRQMAITEVRCQFGGQENPHHTFLKRWPKAIAQYNSAYASQFQSLQTNMAAHPNLFFVSNYIGGVGVNDCIANAFKTVEQISL